MVRCTRSLHIRLPLALLLAAPALAQVVIAPATPQIGSSNPASPEPAVARPTTTPCSVPLLTEQAFANFDNKPITFTPPAGCAGPWSKVVFSADFTVTSGRQFDRTAKFFLGGANLYFGTTAEPRAILSPSWHVENDVTKLSALFHTPQVGQAILGNFVGVDSGITYNGIIYANARLDFYPANAANPAPAVPDAVLAFPANDTNRVSTTTDASTGTFTFPKNLERVYLDVISQSQATDEFWLTCVPTDVAAALENCPNTGFRETEVAIDGKPAGVAPVYPWIYTGGIDPSLWEPLPGIQTLNLKPYRVDLTPFAGLLADGQPHAVAVSVLNANSGFDIASTLLLYTGPAGSVTTGGITANTLTAAPTPNVEAYLNTAADGTVSGPITVQSFRTWQIAGYINTSHGRVDTSIQANNAFKNIQSNKVQGSSIFQQNVTQTSEQHELITTASAAGTVATQHDVSFPVIANYRQAPNDNNDGGFSIQAYVRQQLQDQLLTPLGPNSPNPAVISEAVETSDTLHYSKTGALINHTDNAATAEYDSKSSQQTCYHRKLTANALVLTGVEDSTSCSYAP